ncbi:putative Zn-dependent peptidase [Sphingobacterium allocomposti]|uniref:Putative Zn-dependent peptidase n=1 Tax=Sphingobacterium allocomposti TaxID=415956 RepID=A0A5S5D8Y7_9SPHI|nr:pitrilysin family protein [Sphingobacterium composti Yoo et al. 2007 non Ten et al. 2007]TYP91202.1 putative Zn-dependent peptidase [Sphingobacterium composti Yoo et al. 2007 non Ten et al. 2007]
MEYEVIRLDNGIRAVFHRQTSPITHVCLVVNAGSRDEEEGMFGIAHFIEHLLFKQTERRSMKQILNHLEAVGGDLNAYTTKEYTCVHASILQPHLGKALDLFEDIMFHSTFPEEEMEKEKGVIADEMASYLDSPEESIIDDYEDLIYRGSGLGHNILGLEKDLHTFDKGSIQRFIQQNYHTHEVVIGITGDYKLETVEKMLRRYFEPVKENKPTRKRGEVRLTVKEHVEIAKPINQVHYMLGGGAYGLHDERKTGLLLLNNMLGGFGMSSILNLSVRERYGIAYTIESNYTLFSDTGLFTIYLGTDEEKVQRAKKLVFRELDRLTTKAISDGQLLKAKNKFKGQIALAEENRMSMIIAVAKNIMDYDRVISLSEVFDKIDAVSAGDLLDIAQDVFDERNLSSLAFVPER